MTSAAQPKYIGLGQGKTYQLGGITLTFKIGAADSGAAYTLCEAIEPPDSGAALHRHPSYDETHIICEGNYEFRLGDRTLTLGPGEMAFVPKGTPHSIRSIGPEPGRELIISSPGGIFDAFIDEVVATMTASGNSKPAPSTNFRAIAAKYGIEFLS